MSNNQPNMYALLVGINEYTSPTIPNLGGCVNDVEAMEQLLRDRFNVPQAHIKKLLNQEATHQAIKDAFKNHLIARAKAWADTGGSDPAPVFLFHYSGHGSQTLDETGTEPDGLDETIVPHDSRVNDVFDIKDWELGQLIDELTAPFREEQANVTIILDCCHSGSGTRDVNNPTLIPTRRCEPDLRPQPTKRPDDGVARTRSVSTPSGWTLGGKYVLLAGCRDREESNEYVASGGKELPLQQHGAMTYFMLQELNHMSSERRLTYRDLHERVRYQVNSRYENQMPQCEGAKDREIFGGLKPMEDVLLTVIDKTELIWVSGGAAHGLTEGSQLHVYPPGTTNLKDAGEPLTTLYVEEVGAVKSGCLIESGQQDIELHSRVAIAHIDYSNLQQRVVLDITDAGLRSEVEQLLSEETVKPYIRLAPADQPADLRVQQVGDNLELQDAAGKLLVAAFPPNKRQELPHDIQHLARYYNALKLTNPAGELAGTVEVVFKKLMVEGGQLKTAEITPNAEDEPELVVGERIVIEVTNKANQPLYVAVFNFAHDWSVNQLYPRMAGEHAALEPRRTLSLGLSAKRQEQLTPGLEEGFNEAREFIKVIATVDETDFELLQMGSLKTPGTTRSVALPGKRSALTTLLEQAAAGSGKRAIGTPPSTAEDEWTTTEIQYRLVRPLNDKEISRSLQGGMQTSLSGYMLEVEPPVGFHGQVRVLTARQNTRAADGDLTELEPPPGLAPFRENFEAILVPSSKGTRDVAPGGAIIEIETDDQARVTITENTPLKLHLPEGMTGEGEAMLALAYDGSFFYPVGRPGDAANTVNIEWLPGAALPEEEAIRTRNIGRTVKLYLFKMAGWPEPSLGLRKIRFVSADRIDQEPPEDGEASYPVQGGQACYRELQLGELQPGQRVALIVHGFTSETKPMVAEILPWLAQNGLAYDHHLAFDYETFNTHISENGQILAKALRATGFGPDDNLHLDVFAHSMGTQVTRSMVEQHGGDEFVNRCFLAGPPNMGTKLAEIKRLVPWLGTLLLNQAGPTPPTIIASWVLKKVADDAKGGGDLAPGSEFYQQLNGSDKPAKVPYYILAGRHDLPTEYKNIWDRVAKTLVGAADAGLDMLFGDQHDMVINVQSMLTVRDGNYPVNLLLTKVLPCNHFQYFGSEEGKKTLWEWLKSK